MLVRHATLIAIAALIIFSTPFLQKVTVYSKTDLMSVQCGWPLSFITLDQSWQDPPYPWQVHCSPVRGYDTTADYNWTAFVVNAALFYAGLTLLFYVYSLVRRKQQ